MPGPNTLNGYMQQTQRFLREAKQEMLNPKDLIDYINQARQEVAMRAQCVRRLTPISGSVVECIVTNPGTGYTNPVCTITSPDFPSGKAPFPNGAQATASAILVGDTINAIDITFGGSGYFQPQITIEDPTGVGATAVLRISPINVLVPNQEVYSFRDIDVSMFPGVASVFMIKSVSVIYSNYRYSLPMYSFSTYQAKIRQYPFQYQWVPAFCSQFGQGDDGSFYAYPYPSQEYQWEFDCFCLPEDMLTNDTYEAIPQPWTRAVPYFAAHLAFMELQNLNSGKGYLDLFDKMCLRFSNYARPGRMVNPYGRY